MNYYENDRLLLNVRSWTLLLTEKGTGNLHTACNSRKEHSDICVKCRFRSAQANRKRHYPFYAYFFSV